jgi:hypothetical protein
MTGSAIPFQIGYLEHKQSALWTGVKHIFQENGKGARQLIQNG